ncbi:Ribonucleoprotein [Entamoeba marina]
MSKIYVGNLNFSTTVDELKDAFKDYKPTDIKILQTPIGYSRGFGFIDFADDESAKKALEMNKKEVGGRTIRVELAIPEEKREEQRQSHPRRSNYKGFARRPRNNRYGNRRPRKVQSTGPKEFSSTELFVKNIPFSLTDEELKKEFSSYEVESAVVAKRFGKRSLGFGFVTLKTAEAQKKAIAEMNDATIGERKIVVKSAFRRESKPEGSN